MEKQGRFNEHKSLVRQPAVSGQFYPASPEELRRLFDAGVQFPLVNKVESLMPVAAALGIPPVTPVFR